MVCVMSCCAQFNLINNQQFKWYNSGNGLEENVVNDVVRDRNGNVWISTTFGLTKFDGNAFYTYHHNSPELPLLHDAILQVIPITNNQINELFIATLNGPMLANENDCQALFKDSASPINYVNSAIFSVDSFRIATTNKGMLVFSKNHQHIVSISDLGLDNRISSNNNICVLKLAGEYLVGARNKFFRTLDFKKFHIIDSLGGNTKFIIGVLKKNEKEVLFYGENLLFSYNLDQKHISRNYFQELKLNELKGKVIIETAAFDNDSNLWFGIYKSGLMLLDKNSGVLNKIVLNNDINFSGSNRIHKVYFDSLDNLWVGSDNGLFYLNNKFIHARSYTKNNQLPTGLPGNQCRALLRSERNILIGTTVGIGLLDISTNQIRTLISDPDLVVNCMLKDSKGRLWWGGTSGFGTFSLNGKYQTIHPNEKSGHSISNRIWQIQEKDGFIWFCTLNGHLCRYNPSTNNLDIMLAEANHSFFNFNFENDNIILSGIGKIFKYKLSNNQTTIWDLQPEYNKIQFTKIERLPNGHYLCSTQGKGIFEIDLNSAASKVLHPNVYKDLEQKVVYSFIIYGSKIVAEASSGLYCYSINGSEMKKVNEMALFENPFSFGNTILMTEENDLFIGGSNGLLQLTWNESQESNLLAPVLTSYETNLGNEHYLLGGPEFISESKGVKNILLNFATPWMINQPIHYWAKVKDRIIHLGNSGTLNLSELLPGNNDFWIACSKENSIPSELSWHKYTIHIQAYFYQTLLFKIFILLLLVFLVSFMVWILISNKISKRNAESAILQLQLAKTKAENARLTTMRMQMNPHFLFNTLSGIQSMVIQGKIIESADYITKFAKLIRELFQNSNENFIQIENEFSFIQKYCELQQLRHPHIQVNMENRCKPGLLLPPMLVQPLVENVFLHAFPDIRKVCKLQIIFETIGDLVCIEINDNGVGMIHEPSKGDNHLGISLYSISERFNSLFNKEGNMEIISNLKEGTKIILTFPSQSELL